MYERSLIFRPQNFSACYNHLQLHTEVGFSSPLSLLLYQCNSVSIYKYKNVSKHKEAFLCRTWWTSSWWASSLSLSLSFSLLLALLLRIAIGPDGIGLVWENGHCVSLIESALPSFSPHPHLSLVKCWVLDNHRVLHTYKLYMLVGTHFYVHIHTLHREMYILGYGHTNAATHIEITSANIIHL